MKKIYLALILGIFLFSMVSAGVLPKSPYKQGQEMQITNYCISGDCTYMNLSTLTYPNGTVVNLDAQMTKAGQQFNYSFTPTEIGNYVVLFVADPSGTTTPDQDTFEVTPSGSSGNSNIFFYIIILVLGYVLNLLGFFNRNSTITILGGIILLFVGLFMVQNGIVIYRDNLTLTISYITIFWGIGSALWATIEEIQDNF